MPVENSDDQPTPDPGLLRIIARAHDIQARLMQNTDLTVHVIASQERVSEGYRLSPSLVDELTTGPRTLTCRSG